MNIASFLESDMLYHARRMSRLVNARFDAAEFKLDVDSGFVTLPAKDSEKAVFHVFSGKLAEDVHRLLPVVKVFYKQFDSDEGHVLVGENARFKLELHPHLQDRQLARVWPDVSSLVTPDDVTEVVSG